jgi:phenylacetic acid degradation operon negative regulatory protein
MAEDGSMLFNRAMDSGPIKPRSLVFDLFGDFLRYRGGEIRLQSLMALMEPFDVPNSTVRVVVARMRKEGWLGSRREGKETIYSLSPASWDLLDEGRARIFERAQHSWDGTWHMVIYSIPETERTMRDQLRKKLAWLGFGPLSASVWVSPHDRLREINDSFGNSPVVQLDSFHSRTPSPEADIEIAGRAWDLVTLNREYAELLDAYGARLAHHRSEEASPEQALVDCMTLIHDYRHYPFRDPDLPIELLPDGWCGREVHQMFLEMHGLLQRSADAFVDDCLGSSILAGRRQPPVTVA